MCNVNKRRNDDLKSMEIVYFSNDYIADNRTSSQHIAMRLGTEHRVLHVEIGGARSPRATGGDLQKILRKIRKTLSGMWCPRKNVAVVSVIYPLFLPTPFLKRLNHMVVRLQVAYYIRKMGFKKPVFWCTHPSLIKVIETLPHSLLVYYCVDDFASMPGVNKQILMELDERITRQADLIFTPSHPLYEKKIKANPSTILSPHGVDVEHFAKANSSKFQEAEEMLKYKHPIIGYCGLIEEWIDLDLIRAVALSIPQSNIVMIGRVAVDLSKANLPDNVHFLGARPYEALPEYIRAFDVCIIPYLLNEQVYNANPLKLREYLASGKPIVSVCNPEIERYADVVNLAGSHDEFVKMVHACLEGKEGSTSKERMRRVASDSWDARYAAVMVEVRKAFERKNHQGC